MTNTDSHSMRLNTPINTEEELEDMGPKGREVFRQRRAKDKRHRKIAIGVVLAIAGVSAIQELWMLAGVLCLWGAFSWKFLLSPGNYDAGHLAAARLAESDDPPERLSWEEHVLKYGHRDGDPLTEEEIQAMISGEIDDPEWRREHGLPVSDTDSTVDRPLDDSKELD